MVFFGKMFVQKCIADGTWKWDIDNAAGVDMPNLSASELKFLSFKPMRLNRYSGPRRYLLDKLLKAVHS
jgi:hypothetical protein